MSTTLDREAASTILNRGDAVNLARNVLAGERVSQAGIEALAEAVLAMDEHIRKLTAPKTIAEWQAAKEKE